MTPRWLKIMTLGILFLVAGTALSMASGFGVYGAYDVLIGTLGWYDNAGNFERTKLVQFGILFDTCLAKDRLINQALCRSGVVFRFDDYYE